VDENGVGHENSLRGAERERGNSGVKMNLIGVEVTDSHSVGLPIDVHEGELEEPRTRRESPTKWRSVAFSSRYPRSATLEPR